MDHVVVVGGPPASGKTTVARRLARRHGLRLYSADTQTWSHRDRALARTHRAAWRWERLTPEERWQRPPQEMLEMSLHRERGEMVLADLRALPRSPLVIAEGSVIPAWAISTGVVDASRAVWLLPTTGFQDAQLAARDTGEGPRQLHRLLRDEIERDAAAHGARTVRVDTSRGIESIVSAVEEALGPALAIGPTAHDRGERQRLLRQANLAVVEQVRAFHRRPWSSGDPRLVTQSFVCECGTSECVEEVITSIGEAARASVVSCEHRGPDRAQGRTS